MDIMDQATKYAVIDNNGMIIEHGNGMNTSLCGHVSDILEKSRDILNSKDSVNSVEIFFDHSTMVVKDNCSTNLSMVTVISNSK